MEYVYMCMLVEVFKVCGGGARACMVCFPQGEMYPEWKQWRVEAFRILWNSQVEPRSYTHPACTFPAQLGYPVFVERTSQGSHNHCPSWNLPVCPSPDWGSRPKQRKSDFGNALSASSMDFLTSCPAPLAASSLASSDRNLEAGTGSASWGQLPLTVSFLVRPDLCAALSTLLNTTAAGWRPSLELRLQPSTSAGQPGYCCGSQPWVVLSPRRLLSLLLWYPESEAATLWEGRSSVLINAMPASGHQFVRSSLKKKSGQNCHEITLRSKLSFSQNEDISFMGGS